jgi:signal peptidase I
VSRKNDRHSDKHPREAEPTRVDRESAGGAPGADDASRMRRAWDQIWPMAVAVLIALGIRAMVIESYYVPSESMLPTLLVGDHVFVNKFVYGAHIPFTNIHLPAVRDPKRGEIVVFGLGRTSSGRICPLDKCPEASSEGFVKRLVGLPGDRVEYRNGELYLNGSLVRTHDTGETFTGDHDINYRVLQEELGACKHAVLDIPGNMGLSRSSFTIAEGRYFMLGDNRDNSNDSRAWGTVRRDELKGPVILNYWSWNNRESWLAMLNPITWIRLLAKEMRWGRIGMDYSCRSD